MNKSLTEYLNESSTVILDLTVDQAKLVLELIDRGAAYTDQHYKDAKKMLPVIELVQSQLEKQNITL